MRIAEELARALTPARSTRARFIHPRCARPADPLLAVNIYVRHGEK